MLDFEAEPTDRRTRLIFDDLYLDVRESLQFVIYSTQD
jgi:hypothetical protein